MIEIKNLHKAYKVGTNTKHIAQGVSLKIPLGSSVGIFGRNGAGKSTLLRMIAGLERADRGTITTMGSVSWPVGFAGSFHPDLTGAQNVKFVARLYGVDTGELTEFVRNFAELDVHFEAPFRTYSAGMKARLGFGLSMGIYFGTYLIDEVAAVGDEAFRKKSSAYLKQRVKSSSAIIVSHSMGLLKDLCNCGIVLINGHAKYYADIDEAINVHKSAMVGQLPNWAIK